jgi:preprotein translocase subunit YajC
MKKIIAICLLTLIILANASLGRAQDATSAATVSPTPTKEDKEIIDLKDKIATKVAELNKANQSAVSGYVTKVSDTSFKIKSTDDTEYEIKVDSIVTKFYQSTTGQKKNLEYSNIKKDTYVVVSGPQLDKTINANSVWVDEEFVVLVGKVSEVNKDDLSLKVATSEKDTYSLDIESSTKQLMFNTKTLDLERTGFSKIKEGDTIHFVIKKTNKAETRYSAIRMLIVPQEYFIK